MIISRCRDLPLDRFIDCVVHGQYDRLIIDGEHSQQQINETWDKIWDEYLSIVGLPTHKYVTDLIKIIALLYLKITTVEWNIRALELGYYPDCIEALRVVGIDYKFDPADPIAYAAALEKAVKKSKSWVIEYQDKQKEYDKYRSHASKEVITEQGFIDNIVSLSKVVGYHIDIKKVTVAEYCAMLKMAVNNG